MLPLILSVVASASTLSPTLSLPSGNSADAPPRLELGVLSEPLSGELTQAARGWALAHREHYGLSPLATLEVTDAFATRWGASVHLQVRVNGLDVYGQKLVVTLDANRRVSQVSSSVVPFGVVDLHFLTEERTALRAAAAGLDGIVQQPGPLAGPAGGVAKVLVETGGELHAAYLAHPVSVDPRHNWYMLVDAVTGERLTVQDRVYRAALDAQVYAVSPGGLDAGVGKTATIGASLMHADGGAMTVPTDAGVLEGTQLDAWNCCPAADRFDDAGVLLAECDVDAGPKMVSGTLAYGGQNIAYNVAVCNRKRFASNDPTRHSSGDYVYSPVDPPSNLAVVDPKDPANSDAFAEVHAFYHVNRVYDWLRHLSTKAAPVFPGNTPAITPFQMRDAKTGKKPAVWANVMFPNYSDLYSKFPCGMTIPGLGTLPPCTTTSLSRIDNAAFMPHEQIVSLGFPEYDLGVDTLMIFQGNAADAAYDATVLQHEFGHGAVYSTAGLQLDTAFIDTRSANNESGALHEGFADYIAGAFNHLAEVGPYFGPRALAGSGQVVQQESFLRTLNNTYSCPDVLWGEVHQDSQHVAAALWKARETLFQGSDSGDTFDAAFYAMLVSLSPTAGFEEVAAVMAARAKTAFGGTADQQMTGIFTAKGVIGCSKVLDVGGATLTKREYFGVPTVASTFKNSLIPGPIQFKLTAANGVGHVQLTGQAGGGGIGPLGGKPSVTALVKIGAPVTFTKQGSSIINDADFQVDVAIDNSGNMTGTVDALACGGSKDVYVALTARGGGATLQNVGLVAQAPSTIECNGAVDAGAPDAGSGTETTSTPAVGAGGTLTQNRVKGCGCASGYDLVPMLALLGLGARRRSRR